MKFKKVLLLVYLFIGVFSLSACNISNEKEPEEPTEEQYQIYKLAAESGYTGSYQEWLESIKKNAISEKFPIIIVGNKIDLDDKRAVHVR